MEDKSLERGRATEKDRVRKVATAHLGRGCFCKQGEVCPVDKLEKLILKEIKRAERRVRESASCDCCFKSTDPF